MIVELLIISLEDAKFILKEKDIGVCADIGTFPRLNMVVGNEGWLRELANTGRLLDSHEVLKYGLVTRIFKDQSILLLNLYLLYF